MGRDFFQLEGTPSTVVDEGAFWTMLSNQPDLIQDQIYKPDNLRSAFQPWRHKVDGVTFINVSFRQTIISDFEFEECTFEKCLLVGTIFRNCRFTNCKFVDTNPHRIEFQACYIDPREFDNCLCPSEHANIGVYLFQELLRNNRQQVQPDFADEAQYRFRQWQRFRHWYDLSSADECSKWLSHASIWFGLWLFDKLFASGMRLRRLLTTSICVLGLITLLNWNFSSAFGLKTENTPVQGWADAFYFSTVVVTTLGFGDIHPTEYLGKIAVGCEALGGFVLFALLTSTLYRRLSS